MTSTFVSFGKRGAWRHLPVFHVAGVALGDIHLLFALHAWHLWHWAGPGGTLGRRLGSVDAAVDAAALCVASVALGNTHRRFAWQAWHLWHWAGSGSVHGRRLGACRWLRGDAAALCMAGVVDLGDIHFYFARQVWHLATSTFTARGRRGAYGTLGWLWWRVGRCLSKRSTWQHPPSLCVSGMAGTSRHPPSLCVAGVARLRYPHSFCVAGHLLFALPASAFSLRGRRGTCGTGLALVARLGAAWAPLPRHCGWQPWHLATSTFISRGRHGTW